MVIINTPWKLDKVLLDYLPCLLENFKHDESGAINGWWL
jgi:23S rRNA A2030 N6-methylase RlmJ